MIKKDQIQKNNLVDFVDSTTDDDEKIKLKKPYRKHAATTLTNLTMD